MILFADKPEDLELEACLEEAEEAEEIENASQPKEFEKSTGTVRTLAA